MSARLVDACCAESSADAKHGVLVLMYIHRSFFAQAIIEHPVNPLKSPYAPSFLAAYRASSTILKSVREQFNVWPNTCARFWTMWTFAFSAAVHIIPTFTPQWQLADGTCFQ